MVQTTSTGMPRLCVRVLSPSGSTTPSSSPPGGKARLCGEEGLASSGSEYSWKAFTTGIQTQQQQPSTSPPPLRITNTTAKVITTQQRSIQHTYTHTNVSNHFIGYFDKIDFCIKSNFFYFVFSTEMEIRPTIAHTVARHQATTEPEQNETPETGLQIRVLCV